MVVVYSVPKPGTAQFYFFRIGQIFTDIRIRGSPGTVLIMQRTEIPSQ